MSGYIVVYEDESEEPMEIPLESNELLAVSTLNSIFPRCTGLKYKSTDTEVYRVIKKVDGYLYPPVEGWNQFRLICIFPKENKRKWEEDEATSAKTKKMETMKCTDLIVLNLSWKTDETALKHYFSKYGELLTAQIKREPVSKKSKGYGFIRFMDFDSQVMCLADRHFIDNRPCEVKIPYSKLEGDKQEVTRKIHIGRLSDTISADDLREFFGQFGRVVDVYIPKPFRSFAFVSFETNDAAQNLLGKELDINGNHVVIGPAAPKINNAVRQQQFLGQSGMAGAHHAPQFDAAGNFTGNAAWFMGGHHPTHHQQHGHHHGPGGNDIYHQIAAAQQQQRAATFNGDNTAAMAALNILNSPEVVAAIVNAAGSNQAHHGHPASSQANGGAAVTVASLPAGSQGTY